MGVVTQPAPRRRSVALIISICLNVALVAMILAAAASLFFHRFHGHWEGGPLGIHAMMDVASPQERARIEDIVQRRRPHLHDLSERARAARAAAYKIFAQPSFLQAEVSMMMAEAASQLSPGERQTLAERAGRYSGWHTGHFRRSW
jgi:uncharacterized membrane protein